MFQQFENTSDCDIALLDVQSNSKPNSENLSSRERQISTNFIESILFWLAKYINVYRCFIVLECISND